MGKFLPPSNAQIQAMIALTQGAVALIDAEARILFVNTSLLGHSLENAYGQSLFADVHPDDLPQFKKQLQQCLDQPDVRIHTQLKTFHIDGSTRVFETVLLNKLNDPNIGAIVLHYYDVTEQKISEAKKESHRKFLEKVSTVLSESLEYKATIDRVVSLALDFLGDWCSLVLLAEDGTIDQVTMAHANAEFLNGIMDVRLRWPTSADSEFPLATVILTGEAVHVSSLTPEVLACMDITTSAPDMASNLDGCSFVAVPLKARGHVLGVLSLMRSQEDRYDEYELAFIKEVTSRIALHIDNARLYREAQLAEHQAALQAEITTLLAESLDSSNILQRLAHVAVDSFADYCFVHRFGLDGRLYRAAGAHADPELCGIVNQLLEVPIEPEGHQYINTSIDRDAPTLTRDGAPLVSKMPEGPYKEMVSRLAPNSWIMAPLVARGTRLGGLLLARSKHSPQYTREDVKFVDELARRASVAIDNERLYRESQEAGRIKDQFLATMSHELRTPLTAIAGWSAILQRKNISPKTFEQALEGIQRNVKQQTSLVEDLLDVSRIVTGKLRLEIRSADLQALVGLTLDNMQSMADAKSINVDFLTEGQLGTIACDPDRIQQVLWNLMSNAIKFTPADGSIKVTVRSNSSNAIEIIVSDTGIGITREFLPFVFERFRQFDGSTRRSVAGLGLGLSIVKHLVELHGGSVHAESMGLGHGSTFRVLLPAAAATRVAEAAGR
jgi:PAS domain S-box-containing protein